MTWNCCAFTLAKCFPKKQLRFFALFVSVLSMLVNGTIYTFNAFELSLKNTFNISESNVELISSLGNFGVSIGIIPGLVYQFFGPEVASICSLIVPTAGYFLMYMSVHTYASFFHKNPWVFGVIYFFAGIGAVFSYFAALLTGISNFPEKHRGKVVGLMDASLGASAAVFAAFYGAFFVNGHDSVGDEQNQNMSGYFLLLTICFSVISILGFFFLKVYGIDGCDDVTEESYKRMEEDDEIIDSVEAVECSVDPSPKSEPVADVNLKECLKRKEFYALSFMFILGTAPSFVILSNISDILTSFGHTSDSTVFTILIPVSSACSRLGSGYLSDYLLIKYRLPREILLFVLLVLFIFLQTIALSHLDSLVFLVFLSISTGAQFGSQWCLTPTIMSEVYGVGTMGVNWGFTMIGTAFSYLALSKVYGVFYDNQATDNECMGQKCYVQSFAVMITVTFMSLVMCTYLLYLAYRRHVESRRRMLISVDE